MCTLESNEGATSKLEGQFLGLSEAGDKISECLLASWDWQESFFQWSRFGKYVFMLMSTIDIGDSED